VTFHAKDAVAGLLFIAIGVSFAANALTKLPVGTAFRMGPGYFPTVLSGLLVILGLAIFLRSLALGSGPIGQLPIRGIALIGLAPAVFGATVDGLGLVGAIALSTLVAALSSRKSSFRFAFVTTIALTCFCIGVFSFGLGLPMRLTGPWLRAIGF
jgi:hypothetical protein